MPGDNERQHEHAIPLVMGDSSVRLLLRLSVHFVLRSIFRQYLVAYATIDNSDTYVNMYQFQFKNKNVRGIKDNNNKINQ